MFLVLIPRSFCSEIGNDHLYRDSLFRLVGNIFSFKLCNQSSARPLIAYCQVWIQNVVRFISQVSVSSILVLSKSWFKFFVGNAVRHRFERSVLMRFGDAWTEANNMEVIGRSHFTGASKARFNCKFNKLIMKMVIEAKT